jgi:hypothetical protein
LHIIIFLANLGHKQIPFEKIQRVDLIIYTTIMFILFPFIYYYYFYFRNNFVKNNLYLCKYGKWSWFFENDMFIYMLICFFSYLLSLILTEIYFYI